MLPKAYIDEQNIILVRRGLEREVFNAGAGRRQESGDTLRTTYEFGHNYALLQQGDDSFVDIPSFLKDLCGRTVAQFRHAGQKNLPDAEAFTNCMVSDYRAGGKLQAHVDVHEATARSEGKKPQYYFGDNVIGVIVQPDSKGGLYVIESRDGPNPAHDPVKAMPLTEIPGLAFVLRGKLRREPYYHGVSEIEGRRISVTYRTVHFK